ncbi:hypothetical protein FRB97_000887, partial [Tulasnella sp. 331]
QKYVQARDLWALGVALPSQFISDASFRGHRLKHFLAKSGTGPICSHFGHDNLGASFFFACDHSDCRDAVRVFSTVARQLARTIPSFHDKLVKAVQEQPHASRLEPQEQLRKLALEPLRDVFTHRLLRYAQMLLRLLAEAVKELPPPLRIRIFITSRPKVELRAEFASSVTESVSRVAELHDIENQIVQTDIRLYLRTRLQRDPELVATDSDLERLVEMAGNLFIVASTAANFVEDSRHESLKKRKARLDVLLLAENSYTDSKQLSGTGKAADRGKQSVPYRALDAIFSAILSKAILPEDHDDYGAELQNLHSVLGATVALFDTLSPRSLDLPLGLEPDTVTENLEQLHSVIIVPNDNVDSTPLRLIHPSFPNFLTNPDRCADKRFFVDA